MIGTNDGDATYLKALSKELENKTSLLVDNRQDIPDFSALENHLLKKIALESTIYVVSSISQKERFFFDMWLNKSLYQINQSRPLLSLADKGLI